MNFKNTILLCARFLFMGWATHAALMLMLCACSPSRSEIEKTPPKATVQSLRVESKPTISMPRCENAQTEGDVWIHGAHIHTAAYFAARVFRIPIVVLGGSSKPLFVHLRQKDTESALNLLATTAGMHAIQFKGVWVMVPESFSIPLPPPAATRTSATTAEWMLYLIELDALFDTLGVQYIDNSASAKVSGHFSAFGEMNTDTVLQILAAVSGGRLERKGNSRRAFGTWVLPPDDIPYQPLTEGCDDLLMRDVKLPRTRVAEMNLQATTIGTAPVALLVSGVPTCNFPAAVVQTGTYVGASVTKDCGYEQCNYQVHAIHRDKVVLTLDSGRCDRPLQMKEAMLPACDF